MKTSIRVLPVMFLAVSVLGPTRGEAQWWETHRIVYHTVYDQQPVTAYRLQYETVMHEEQVTTYRPVWETEIRQRRYTVAKPVVETSWREERYTVMKPVWETQYRDQSYDRVRYVDETHSREERYTVMKPVWETQEREERIVVRKPVTQTEMRDQTYTTYQPVTTYYTQQVDQGGYVNQQTYQPGPVRNRLRWMQRSWYTDPVTGLAVRQRGGLYWVPNQRPGRYTVARVWVPNVVAQQVPVTTYPQQTVVQKVPVQVTRYVDEVQVRKTPVQVCRWQQEEHVRQVPYTVRRQVVERVEQKVPVQVCRWQQQRVRKVPVTTQRIEYEERVEEVQVQVCKYVAQTQTVQHPHTVAKWVPYAYNRLVPRTVAMRVPVDCCGNPVVGHSTPTPYYPAAPSVAPDAPPAETRVEKQKTDEQPEPSVLKKKEEPADISPALPEGEASDKKDQPQPKDTDSTGKPKLK